MDISLERRCLNRYREVYKDTLYCEISADCVVPDTQNDIRKLLNTSARAMLKSKDIAANSIHIGGELAGELPYLPEDGDNIELLNISIPFDCDVHTQNADASCLCFTDIRISALDCRTLNPRKVTVRAELEVKLRCFKEEKYDFTVGISDKPDKLFFKTLPVKSICPTFIGEKQLTFEESFGVGNENGEETLLCGKSSYEVCSAERVGNKLIVKGRTDISILLADMQGRVRSCDFNGSFSQLFELSHEYEVSCWDAVVMPVSEYYSYENGEVNVRLHAVTELICYSENETEYVSDAYFCGKNLEFEYEELELPTAMKKTELSANATLRYEAESMVTDAFCSEIRFGKIRIADESANASVSAELIYDTDNAGANSAKVRGELVFALPEYSSNDIKCVKMTDVKLSVSDNTIEISVCAALLLESREAVALKNISALSANDPEDPERSASIYLCRRQGRDLWSIAKLYGSSEEMIRLVNKSEDDDIDSERLLIVPTI